MEKETLVDYMLKIQNAADYLIRGGLLGSFETETTIEIRDDEVTRQKNAFSICEYSIDDELEEFCYGELKSIEILMKFIQDGEYERQVKGKLETSNFNTNTKFYKKTMNRAKSLLKYITVAIISGHSFKLTEYDFKKLKNSYLNEEELCFYEYEVEGFLRYDVMKGQFVVVNSEGETIIEDVAVKNCVPLVTEFLYQKEKEKMRREAMKPYVDQECKEER